MLYMVRTEISKRLKAYKRVYHKNPHSYSAHLGIGRVPKSQDKPFDGFSIDGKRYKDGIFTGKIV